MIDIKVEDLPMASLHIVFCCTNPLEFGGIGDPFKKSVQDMFGILRHRCIPGPSRVLNISQRLKESSFRNKRNLTLTNLTPGLVVNETSNHHQPQRFPWDAPHQSLKAWRLRPWFRCHWLEISLERKVKWLFRLLRRPVIFGVQRVPTRERTQV